MPAEKNIEGQIIACARKKYKSNKIIQIMVNELDRIKMDINLNRPDFMLSRGQDTFDGYRKGAAGELGFNCRMVNVDMTVLQYPLRVASLIVRYTAVLDVLAASLNSLGEQFEY